MNKYQDVILPLQKQGLTKPPVWSRLKTPALVLLVLGAFLLSSYLDGCDTPAPVTTSTQTK